jgi:dienelactone hydrolase
LDLANDDPTRDVVIPAGSAELTGTLWWPRHPRGVVIFAHGLGGTRFSPGNRIVAAHLTGAGFAALTVDLMPEPRAASLELRAAPLLMAQRLAATAEWTTRQPEIAGLPIGLFGVATGGEAVLMAAAQHPDLAFAVVCRGRRLHLSDQELQSIGAPTLLIGSLADGSAQSWTPESLNQFRCQNNLVVLPVPFEMAADHGATERIAELARDWFDRHSQPPTSIEAAITRINQA